MATIDELLADPRHTSPDPEAEKATRGDPLDDPRYQQPRGTRDTSGWVEVAPGVFEDPEAPEG